MTRNTQQELALGRNEARNELRFIALRMSTGVSEDLLQNNSAVQNLPCLLQTESKPPQRNSSYALSALIGLEQKSSRFVPTAYSAKGLK